MCINDTCDHSICDSCVRKGNETEFDVLIGPPFEFIRHNRCYFAGNVCLGNTVTIIVEKLWDSPFLDEFDTTIAD